MLAILYNNVFESSQRRTFKLANPKHERRTEHQSGRFSQSQLSWLQGRNVYTLCTKNYCVNRSFSLVCPFLDKIKSLVFSLLRYWDSILIWIFDWKEMQNKRKKWIKKRAKTTPMNEWNRYLLQKLKHKGMKTTHK